MEVMRFLDVCMYLWTVSKFDLYAHIYAMYGDK